MQRKTINGIFPTARHDSAIKFRNNAVSQEAEQFAVPWFIFQTNEKEKSMTEDVQSYKKRLLGYLGDRDPMQILANTPERLRQLLQQDDAAGNDKTTSDRWSRLQLLAHFTEGEMVFSVRLRIVATDSGANIQAYDQEKFMKRAGYLFEQPEKTLALFSAIRNANLAYIKNLPQEAWENYGIHSERGKETIRDLVSLVAAHDLNHLKQFESAK